jgi:polysaccharide biosynthesis/export protein
VLGADLGIKPGRGSTDRWSVKQGHPDRNGRIAFMHARLLLLAVVASVLGPGSLSAQAAPKAPVATPAQASAGSFKDRPPYQIGPGDVLQITVWNEPQVSQASIIVLPDGKVNLPLVGEVTVAGHTIKETEDQLALLFKPVITDPEVSVSIKESNSQRIFMVGAVRKEGAIKLVTQLTVLQAIAEAGGLSEFARRSKIYVLRNQGGKQIALPFDYNAVLRGERQEQNVYLQTGDTVVVPH